jgi:hypothetical protein
MKQLVTIFRAEGPQAARAAELCAATPEEEIFSLRDSFRQHAIASSRFSAYTEFIDSWSMWDDFSRIGGDGARKHEALSGEAYVIYITDTLTSSLRYVARKKHQFTEQDRLARVFADLTTSCYLPDGPAVLILFREVLGLSTTDEEIIEGSNQLLNRTQ